MVNETTTKEKTKETQQNQDANVDPPPSQKSRKAYDAHQHLTGSANMCVFTA